MEIKISEFDKLSSINPNDLFTIVRNGNNYIIPCSAIDIINRNIISNKSVVLSGDSVVIGRLDSQYLSTDDGFIYIKDSYGSVLVNVEETILGDSVGTPSVGWSNRVLNNNTGFPVMAWSDYVKTTYYNVSGDSYEDIINTVTKVTRVSATSGQTLSGEMFCDETTVVTPVSALTTLTWVLPTSIRSRVGQVKTFISTRDISNFTVNVGGGGSKLGNALAIAYANESYSYQCISTSGTGTWIRLA